MQLIVKKKARPPRWWMQLIVTFNIKNVKKFCFFEKFSKKTVLFTFVEKFGTFCYPSWKKKLKKSFLTILDQYADLFGQNSHHLELSICV